MGLLASSIVKASGLFLWRSKWKSSAKGGTVQNEAQVVFLALDFHHSFIGMPLVGVGIQHRKELYNDVLEHGAEAVTQLLIVV